MTTITKDGKKVGIINNIAQYFKVSGGRLVPRIVAVSGLAYLSYVGIKTAMDSVPYAIDRLIVNGSFGATNLESLAGDPDSTAGRVATVATLATVSALGYLSWKYVIMPMWKGGAKVTSQSSELASDSHRRKEEIDEVDHQIDLGMRQAEGEVRIAAVRASGRTGAI